MLISSVRKEPSLVSLVLRNLVGGLLDFLWSGFYFVSTVQRGNCIAHLVCW